jgi:uncharacterized RDD family membrane protein YckC
MNLEQSKNQKKTNNQSLDDIEFDFKPITSGLGFHHQKSNEVKPVFTERTVAVSPLPQQAPSLQKKDMNVYQNDLSMFYNNQASTPAPMLELVEEKISEEKYYRLASKSQRVVAYIVDLFFVASVLAIVLTVMAKTINMDLMDIWSQYPNEITPLVMTLFCGFYLIYFSVFDKTGSTLGKSMFNLRVTDKNDKSLSLVALNLRSTVSLLNFVSLGLFSYFDLQNKVTGSKVIRMD